MKQPHRKCSYTRSEAFFKTLVLIELCSFANPLTYSKFVAHWKQILYTCIRSSTEINLIKFNFVMYNSAVQSSELRTISLHCTID